jgi:allantoate deiminase
MGSRAVTGTLDRRRLDEVTDDQGLTVAEAMRQLGMDPDQIDAARRADIAAYLELHIEQGPILEKDGIPIGVVQSIVGIQQVRVTVHGRADHAGGTPMDMRKDALVGAARMITRISELAARTDGGVMTVGRISALPGSANVVPETVEFSIDIRHHVQEVKQGMLQSAQEACEEIAAAAGLGLEFKPLLPGSEPVALADRIQALLRDCCRELGLRYLDMPSKAGHDARNLALQCPTGMIFIPCKEGRSHTPVEYASAEEMERGIAVLSRCLYKLAYEEALGARS